MKSLNEMNGRIGILVGAVLMLANAGCSTPPVPEYESNSSYNSASRSYQNCVNRLYPADQGGSCDQVLMVNGYQSYPSYVYGSSYGKTGSTTGALSNKAYAKAYEAYLSTIEPSKLAEMQAEWDRLAAEAESN